MLYFLQGEYSIWTLDIFYEHDDGDDNGDDEGDDDDDDNQECWSILQHRDWSNDKHKSHFEVKINRSK